MLFQKDNVSVRYVVEEGAPIISKWLTDPEVLQYYEGRDDPQSVEMVLNRFIHNPNGPEKRCLIEFDDVPIGYIFKCIQLIRSGKHYMAMKNRKMYGGWINLLENRLIGEKELEQNLLRPQLHTF